MLRWLGPSILRTDGVALPRRFHVAPVYDWAQARVRRELLRSAA
jgi:hypothetical protein